MKKQDVFKDNKPLSVYDDKVDWYKVEKLSPSQKHKLFPNDFAPDGQPYGDY